MAHSSLVIVEFEIKKSFSSTFISIDIFMIFWPGSVALFALEEFINIVTSLVTYGGFASYVITSEFLTNQSISKGSWAVLIIYSIYLSARHYF